MAPTGERFKTGTVMQPDNTMSKVCGVRVRKFAQERMGTNYDLRTLATCGITR